MANEWKQIAEVYRNREHKLLKDLQNYATDPNGDINKLIADHLASTGRTADSPLDTPPISQPDEDVRARLLQVLNMSKEASSKYRWGEDFLEITDRHGVHTILFDREDRQVIEKYNWNINHSGGGYPIASGGTAMHRYFIKAKEGEVIDHIDRNPLNNRKSNLRLATPQQNSFNRAGAKYSTSKYKGVNKRNNTQWTAAITKGGVLYKQHFDSELEAAKQYDKWAIDLFGDFAYLNFPPSEAELGAVLPRSPSLTKSGKPRKQRSDKGKLRGKRKVA